MDFKGDFNPFLKTFLGLHFCERSELRLFLDITKLAIFGTFWHIFQHCDICGGKNEKFSQCFFVSPNNSYANMGNSRSASGVIQTSIFVFWKPQRPNRQYIATFSFFFAHFLGILKVLFLSLGLKLTHQCALLIACKLTNVGNSSRAEHQRQSQFERKGPFRPPRNITL